MNFKNNFSPISSGLMYFVWLVLIFIITACSTEPYETKTATDSNGFTYEYVSGDPAETRIYTLENELKVYLSYNADEPRIATLIGVNAGSTSDPSETTGLAHYFEHMMFKGTDEIASLDWDKEKVVLDQISDLFEAHRSTDIEEEKKNIYLQIDSLSQIAAGYAAPNEYDKMVSSLGAKRTNAGTSSDKQLSFFSYCLGSGKSIYC